MTNAPTRVEQGAELGSRPRPADVPRATEGAGAPAVRGPVSRTQLAAVQRAAGNRAAAALVRAGRGPATVVQRQDRDGGTATVTAEPDVEAGAPEVDAAVSPDAGAPAGPQPDAGGAPEAGAPPDAGAQADADAGARPPGTAGEQAQDATGPPRDAAPDASTESAGRPGPETEAAESREPEAADDGGPPVDVLEEERRACSLEPGADHEALVEEWGLPGSPERQAKVTEAVDRANFWQSLGEGFAAGGAIGVASAVAQSGVARFMATRGISQAAKAAGPAGAIISGAISGYALWKRFSDPSGRAAVANLGNVWNQGQGDELWANRFHVVAEVLDIIGNIADVLSGVMGAVAIGGTLIGLIPGMQWVLPAVPIATKISFWAGIVGLACGLLKAAAQHISRKFRENHLLHMELTDEASLRAQQEAITATARATYNFVGGMAGAGTVALGSRAVGGRPAGDQAQGRPALGPLEQTSVRARQSKSPEQLGALRQVDDAVAGRQPGSTPPDEVGQSRAATDQRTADADAAGERHAAATRDADAARSRADETAASSRKAGDDHAARQQQADEAARHLDETTSRARAEADSPTSRGRQLSEAADQHSQRAADYDRRAADLEAPLGTARRERDATLAARDQKQRAVDEATATEAAALRQYEGMERGQMALALARDAARRRQAAQTELDALDARLRQQEGEVHRLEVEHGAMRDLASSERREAARLHGEAAAEAQARGDEVRDAHRTWEDARREAEEAGRAANEQSGQHAAARQAERDRAAGVRQAEQGVTDAHGRLEEAHGAEVASQREPETGLVRDVSEKAAGGGGGAQNVTGAGSQTTPAEQEVEIPLTCQAPPAPTSSAAVEQLNVTAAANATVAAQARDQQAEAEAEAQARDASGQELDRMTREVGGVQQTAGTTADALGQKAERRTTLEANSAEVTERMGTFGEKMSDLTTFASFVGRILQYASGLTHDLMPTGVQNAGRRVSEFGRSLQENVSGTQAGIGERRAAEGADATRRAADRAALDTSQRAMPATDSDLGASVEQLGRMQQGNQEIRAGAAAAAAANAGHAEQAEARAAAALAERDAQRGALETWADEARQSREAEIERTRATLEEQGYEVTEVTGA